MGRTRVRWARAAVAAALMGSLVVVTGRAALGGAGGPEAAPRNRADAREAAPRVVVRPGDTLWEIARAVVGSEGDPRPLVERIREANGIASSEPLLPGTSLVVPAR